MMVVMIVSILDVDHLLLALKAEIVDGDGDGGSEGDQHPDHCLQRGSGVNQHKNSRCHHKSEPAVATKGVLHNGVDGVPGHHLHPLQLHLHPLQQGLSKVIKVMLKVFYVVDDHAPCADGDGDDDHLSLLALV